MRKIWTIIVSLLLTISGFGQSVNTKDYTAKWISLPKPETPSLISRGGADPYTGGEYDIAYSLVDRDNKITPMSPINHISVPLDKSNWSIMVDTPGLTKDTGAVATIFWIRKTSSNVGHPFELDWRPLGGQGNKQNNRNVVYPYLPIGAYENHALRGHLIHRCIMVYAGQAWFKFEDPFWRKDSVLQAPTTAPTIKVYHIPNVSFDFCYSFVGNVGEVLSDPITISALPNVSQDSNSGLKIASNHTNLVNGIVCKYVYLRKTGTTKWHRQKPARAKEETGFNTYAWYVTSNSISLGNFEESNVEPSLEVCKSYVSPIQQAIQGSTGSVIVDSDQMIYSPIISPLNVPMGTRRDCLISATNGAKWKIRTSAEAPDGTLENPQQVVGGYPRNWPIWVENAIRTKLVNCDMISDTAEAGIHFVDSDNGGAQHMICESLGIYLVKPLYNAGIVQYIDGAANKIGGAPNDHSASEITIRDSNIQAKFPIIIEWKQSAGWNFNNTICNSNNEYDTAIITLNNTGSAIFTGRNNFESARTIAALVSAKRITIENIFLDGGIPNYFTVCGEDPYIKATFNKTNHNISPLSLLEYPNQGPKVTQIDIDVFEAQNNPQVTVTPFVFTPRWEGIIIRGNFVKSFWANLKYHRPIQDLWKKSGYYDDSGIFLSYAFLWDGWNTKPADAVPRPKLAIQPLNYNSGGTDNITVYGWGPITPTPPVK